MPGRARSPLFLSFSIVALAACGGEGGRSPQRRADVTLGTFVGSFDAATRTMTFFPAPAGMDGSALAAQAAGTFVPVNVVQDGTPFSGPADSVELRTVSSGVVPAGCGARDAFEGDVQINSFYATTTLHQTYVEIVSLSMSGFESCNSAPSPDPGISNVLGLFSYGEIAPSGSATARWNFALPSAQSFTFTGRVVAQLSRCGDGVTDIGEFCDDGFADDCGTCNATCTGPGTGSVCGDGLVCPEAELCDNGVSNSDTVADACRTTCVPAACGDHVVDTGETCDDGNLVALDGCSAVCAIEPGDNCANPFDLVGMGAQGDGTYVFRHDTRLLTADYAAPCSRSTRWQDAVAVFQAPTAGNWTFATTSTFDVVLWVTDSCAPGTGTTLACVDAAGYPASGRTADESTTVALTAGQTVYVFVDGYDSLVFVNKGTFTLTASLSP